MLKKIFTATLFIGLIGSFFSVLVLSNTNKKINEEKLSLMAENADYKYETKRFKEKYEQTIFSENDTIDNIALTDINSGKRPISDLLDSEKLIYRFYESTCVQCVEDELKILKNIEAQIGSDKIMIISDFPEINRFRALISRIEIKAPIFIYRDKINLSIDQDDDHHIATFFVVNPDRTVDLVYKSGGTQNIEDPYYQRILKYFNQKKN